MCIKGIDAILPSQPGTKHPNLKKLIQKAPFLHSGYTWPIEQRWYATTSTNISILSDVIANHTSCAECGIKSFSTYISAGSAKTFCRLTEDIPWNVVRSHGRYDGLPRNVGFLLSNLWYVCCTVSKIFTHPDNFSTILGDSRRQSLQLFNSLTEISYPLQHSQSWRDRVLHPRVRNNTYRRSTNKTASVIVRQWPPIGLQLIKPTGCYWGCPQYYYLCAMLECI